jgi:hydantoinase/carbamoylase family amidase
LSGADLTAKAWFKKRLLDAGLEVHEDGVLNQIGKLPGVKGKRPVVIGSHLDTVPGGGAYDGALGVLAGLECLRTLKESGLELDHDLEVINFTDEEGAHGIGTVGSRAMLGLLTQKDLESSGFGQSLAQAGGNPDQALDKVSSAGDFKAYLELHIEQGRVLESRGDQIGAVSAIVGIKRYKVTVLGEPGHAGTTPMGLRKDALVEAAPLFGLLPQWVGEQNPLMVGTIGSLALLPGAANVIPAECSFTVELRSARQVDLDKVEERLFAYAKAKKNWSVEMVYDTSPVDLSRDIMELIEKACQDLELACHVMASGAGHDAHSFAVAGVKTGMIFVPCAMGLSHCPLEAITSEQAAWGCQVLMHNIVSLTLA